MANTYEKLDNLIFNDLDGKCVVFRNFAGKESRWNQQGKRTFNIMLTEEEALELEAKGWRIKKLNPKKEGDPVAYTLKVRVSFGLYPPKVYLVTSHKKTLLDDEDVSQLDKAEIVNADLIITPYINRDESYASDGKASAYLKLAYFTIPDNPFEDKYADYE